MIRLPIPFRSAWRTLLLSLLALGAGLASAQDAGALKARHAALAGQLADNPFKRPLVLESVEASGELKGDVYAVLERPFATVAQSLSNADQWCEVLILHLNVKGCRASKATPPIMSVSLGRKFDQSLDEAYKADFVYKTAASEPDYLNVQMSAANGPLGTRNYRIALEAVPLDAQRSFIHMAYAYGYGTAARFAMNAYLATIGSDKVGFSASGRGADGKPIYVGGVRGVVERNTMRYFLAIESYLGAPAQAQVDKRLTDWFDATERYPQQLHEMERAEYLEMKKKEVRRQRDG
ncbi:MAG: hypothetical protein ABIO45_04730 [Burkholderiaceae bacterium]